MFADPHCSHLCEYEENSEKLPSFQKAVKVEFSNNKRCLPSALRHTLCDIKPSFFYKINIHESLWFWKTKAASFVLTWSVVNCYNIPLLRLWRIVWIRTQSLRWLREHSGSERWMSWTQWKPDRTVLFRFWMQLKHRCPPVSLVCTHVFVEQ